MSAGDRIEDGPYSDVHKIVDSLEKALRAAMESRGFKDTYKQAEKVIIHCKEVSTALTHSVCRIAHVLNGL